VQDLSRLKPPLLNRAKEILAFEATIITHGKNNAVNAYLSSIEKFGESDPGKTVETSSSITEIAGGESEAPSVKVKRDMLTAGFTIVDAFVEAGLVKSRGEARRLIQQGGAYIEEQRVSDDTRIIKEEDFNERVLDLRAGKKRHMRLVLE